VSSALTTLTFDFWNTLYSADHGSWDRVKPRRMKALRGLLRAAGARPTGEDMERVYTEGFETYMAAWTGGRHFGAREEAFFFLERFGVESSSVDEEELASAVIEIENAARRGTLPLVSGVAETIPRLAASGYRLGLISDTSLTPGRVLREFMEKDGLLQYFSVLTFSDETGYPKPDPRMFTSTLGALAAEPSEAAHIGDTPRTDILGANNVGMVAIRCAGVVDQTGLPDADFVIWDHRELPAILQGLR
jgi:HAD superfamily hydrolase (TIGR01549 family)